MRSVIRYILDRLHYFGGLRRARRAQGSFRAGDYYPPIPAREEVCAYLESTQSEERELLEIDLNEDGQAESLRAFRTFYDELPFPEEKSPDSRYYFSQSWFCYADAIFLYCFLRHTNPRRIIEVGSGFSSAVILDTAERFLQKQPEIVFIEPYPDRLRQLLKPQDQQNCEVVERKVQEVPIDTFTSLRAGDLLFIGSSHVMTCGSDVQFLMFEVLPRLPVGIFVHFHDVFYPFEYPSEWLLSGRYWNEDYFLRAFLAYNNEWEIYFFNAHIAKVLEDFLAEEMPLCLKNTGGSIYLRRVEKG